MDGKWTQARSGFLCNLPSPINSQCSSLIVRNIMWVLLILLVYITQRCPATCLLPITKNGIEIIIFLDLADLIILCCHTFRIHAVSFSPCREIFACILTGAGWCWRGHLGNQEETHKAWYYSWELYYFYLPKLAASKMMGWRLYARDNQNKCSQQQHHEEQTV